jgi:hypothetical protein
MGERNMLTPHLMARMDTDHLLNAISIEGVTDPIAIELLKRFEALRAGEGETILSQAEDYGLTATDLGDNLLGNRVDTTVQALTLISKFELTDVRDLESALDLCKLLIDGGIEAPAYLTRLLKFDVVLSEYPEVDTPEDLERRIVLANEVMELV